MNHYILRTLYLFNWIPCISSGIILKQKMLVLTKFSTQYVPEFLQKDISVSVYRYQYKVHTRNIMMTPSNGNIFRVTGLCAGNSPVSGEFPSQRPVTRSFNIFFDLCMNKWLSKQSWGSWFETPSCPFWHHCNVHAVLDWFCFVVVWCQSIIHRSPRISLTPPPPGHFKMHFLQWKW